MSKFLLLSACTLFTFSQPANLPAQQITGHVYDQQDGSPLPGVSILLKGTTTGTVTDETGLYSLSVPNNKAVLVFAYVGYATQEIVVGTTSVIDVKLTADTQSLQEVVIIGYGEQKQMAVTGSVATSKSKRTRKNAQSPMDAAYEMAPAPSMSYHVPAEHTPRFNTEEYDAIRENGFREATNTPLSTFSIDVDAASYSNVRRFINQGQMPPKDAVRIEEMVNYFTYEYPQPAGDAPFSVNTEVAVCPWQPKHRLVHIGLQGKKIPAEKLPPSNLVFLIDVSGSMDSPEKLPLLQSAFRMLVEQLRPQDRVAMVVYAGAAGLVLPSTSGGEKEKILAAISQLEAGGSTAGGAGIKLAYQIAQENLMEAGNNRVILASDGDFNVGVSSNAEMERLIEEKRKSGISLTVLGFGMGNYKDSKMEILANKGNGNYAYVDNLSEARKVLVSEFGGTLFTIAKDVKIQVEFNPANVKAYRLIGYENRALANEDFNNDQKDAGELGSGHTVTALYEVIPADVQDSPFIHPVDDLKYQSQPVSPKSPHSSELLTLKLRYKQPRADTSQLITTSVLSRNAAEPSGNFRFSAAVAEFGMLLRNSEFKGNATYAEVVRLAQSAKGKDEAGYRTEFINLVNSCQWLAGK